MINDEKVIQIISLAMREGREAAKAAFNLSDETFNRYLRKSRPLLGDVSDIIDMRSNFTPAEIKAIAKGSRMVPGYGKVPILDFQGEVVTFGVMGDTHIGHQCSEPHFIPSALQAMKEHGCQFICHVGDLTEGMTSRKGHIYELDCIGYTKQRDEALRRFETWDRPLYIINGNHDGWYNTQLDAGCDIVQDFASRRGNTFYLGANDGDVSLNGIVLKLWHGGDGSAYALSYRDQKLIESFSGGEKPHILMTGHIHKAYYFFYRNIHVIGAGCLERQTTFMKMKKIQAHVGFWIVKVGAVPGSVNWIEPRWFPFYA